MVVAVAVIALFLLVVLAVLIGMVLREEDEVRTRPGRHDDRGPG